MPKHAKIIDLKLKGTSNAGGKINLIAAIDSREVSHTVTSRNTLWQSNASSGQINQTLHMANINVPVGSTHFQGAGGITVQLPKGSALPAQIAALAKQPGNEYLGDLAKRSDIDWKQIEVINKTWNYKKEGITQEAAIIIAIVVTIFTAGAAASAAGSIVGTTAATATTAATLTGTGLAAATGMSVGVAAATTAAVAAGITTLATQAAIALLNNKGDVAGALKELGSKENVKGLAIAMLTAGAVQGLGTEFGLVSGGKATLLQNLQTNLVNGVASSLISTAINGGSLEDALKHAAKNAVINALASQGADVIGNANLDIFSSNLAHAILGCAVGSATAGNSSGCAAGAGGAVVGHLSAQWYGDQIGIGGLTGDELAQAKLDVANFAKLTTALASLVGGANAMTIAGITSSNAVLNNYLSNPELRARDRELKACQANNDPSCEVKVLQKYDKTSATNSAEINYSSVLTKGSLEEVKKGLENLLNDPTVSVETKQQARKSLQEVNVALNVIEKSPIIKNAAEVGLLAADILTLGELATAKLLTTKVVQELVLARTGTELSETEAAKIANNFYTDGAQFSSNFINGRPIANLRLEYEQASRDIQSQTAKMLASGASDEQVARWAVEQRNQLKLTYRDLTPASMLTAIEARNIERYGNALGPTIDQLRSKGKTWNDIITGAAKPGGLDLDFAPPGFFTGPKQ